MPFLGGLEACRWTIKLDPNGNPIVINGGPLWMRVEDCNDPACRTSNAYDPKLEKLISPSKPPTSSR